MKYVLITPAKNKETFITKTLDSVVAQTVLPERWVIVDDSSTDQTAEIVERYAKRYPWIELVRRVQDRIAVLLRKLMLLLSDSSGLAGFSSRSWETLMPTFLSKLITWNS